MKLDNTNFKITTKGNTYYFTTALRMRKFVNLLEKNREEVRNKIMKRYRVNVSCDLLADAYLYQTIENRGFLIETSNGKKYRSDEEYLLYIDKI